MRQLDAEIHCPPRRQVASVVTPSMLARQFHPDRHFLVKVTSERCRGDFLNLKAAGLSNLIAVSADGSLIGGIPDRVIVPAGGIEEGDVVAVDGRRKSLPVLYRESDRHHTVFLTNRCNSYCLMCSQPPTFANDDWLVEEAIEVAKSMISAPEVIGFSGGEPLLLGQDLRRVLDAFLSHHPESFLEVLTNGRGFANQQLARHMLSDLPPRVSWMVPLYGHCDFLHDFVVQAPGAFDQTIGGLLELQSFRQQVQIRVVLIRPVLEALPDLCEFIGRNLPFAADIALMGCEPTGFALANRELCEVDYSEWASNIEFAAESLEAMDLRCRVMNIPRCLLSDGAARFAVNSISDWKRVYPAECEGCTAKSECTGLFASFERGWKPGRLRPRRESV